MTHTDFGVTGAKRTSIEDNDPLKLLWNIRESHPSDGSAALLRKFMAAVKDEPDMLDAVIAYCFANLQHRIEHPKKTLPRMSGRKSAMVQSMKGRLQSHIEERAQEILMDLAMPNGKRLGDCTISYCARLGGWMSRLAKGKNPRQTVSFVYSEEELKQLRKG